MSGTSSNRLQAYKLCQSPSDDLVKKVEVIAKCRCKYDVRVSAGVYVVSSVYFYKAFSFAFGRCGRCDYLLQFGLGGDRVDYFLARENLISPQAASVPGQVRKWPKHFPRFFPAAGAVKFQPVLKAVP